MFAIGEICLSRNRIAACVEPYAEPTVRGRAMRLTSRLKHPTWTEPGVFLSSGISARTRKYMPARYCECHVNGVHCVLQFSKKKGTHCCATVFWLIVFLTFIQNKQFVGNGRLWAHSGTNGECPTGSGCAQRNPAVPNGSRLCQTESGIVARTFGESTWAHFRVVSLTAQHASVHSSSAENKGALHFKIFLRIIMNKSKHLRAISMQYLYIFIMHAYAIHVSGRSSTFKSHMRRKYVYVTRCV